MAPCDPYMDAPSQLSVHERLASILENDDKVRVMMPNNSQKNVLDLPKELLVHVFSYIHGKHDLAQICKVNRPFFAAALPQLYHSLRIIITGAVDPLLAQMFTFENVGLRFVRNVNVHVDRAHGSNPHPAHQWLQMLINLIPKDSLDLFIWNNPHPLPISLMKLLWQRQKIIERLEIIPKYVQNAWGAEQENGDVDLLVELNRTVYPNLKRVRVALSDVESATLACAALQRGNATELDVDGCVWQNGDAHDNENDEEPEVHDPLTELLFSHIKKAEPHCKPQYDILTSLALKDINLTLCKHTWLAYLNLSKLQELSLKYCTAADIFLMQLASTAGADTSGLRSFSLVHDLGTHADRTIHAIDELMFFPRHTLHTLELCLRNAPELPKATSIRAHSKSLKRLLLDVAKKEQQEPVINQGWNEPAQITPKYKALAYGTADFESIVESCTSLVELGLAFPRVGLEYYHFSTDCDEFATWVDVVAKNLQLATLNITNWPANYKCGQGEGYYIAKNLQLARLASNIFQHHRRYDRETGEFTTSERGTPLEVVAFGVKEHGTKLPLPAYFIQCEVNAVGKHRLHVEGVSWDDLEDNDFDIRILHYPDRDFDETSRKSLGESLGWDAVSNNGDGWGGD